MTRQGIPYTVGEARLLATKQSDPYVREVMMFLIAEIERAVAEEREACIDDIALTMVAYEQTGGCAIERIQARSSHANAEAVDDGPGAEPE